jgi:hypothetical protein
MPPLAHFDLGSDPGEKCPLDVRYADFGADWRSTETAIAHTHRGIDIRFMTSASAPQQVSLSFNAPPAAPFALDGGDSITAPGNTTAISTSDAPFDVDGVLLKSDGDSVTAHMLADGPCVVFPGNGGAALRKKGDAVTLKVAPSIPRFELDQSGCVTGFAWNERVGRRTDRMPTRKAPGDSSRASNGRRIPQTPPAWLRERRNAAPCLSTAAGGGSAGPSLLSRSGTRAAIPSMMLP